MSYSQQYSVTYFTKTWLMAYHSFAHVLPPEGAVLALIHKSYDRKKVIQSLSKLVFNFKLLGVISCAQLIITQQKRITEE